MTSRTTLPTVLIPVLLAMTGLAAPVLAGGGGIFSDGFESGDVSAWDAAVGYVEPATPFLITDLDLRDPHVFVDFVVCNDVTDTELLGFSFNGSIADAITLDGDGDGFLDFSLMLLARPADLTAVDERLDIAAGICTDPIETTVCDQDPMVEPTITVYDSQAAGTCLQPVPGTTSGYSPAISEPAAPCFVTDATTVTVNLSGVEVPLEDAQVAGTWVGDPPTGIVSGLLSGFLSEAVADTLLLPPDLPIIGGQPLTILLAGGMGNCASGDDRDMLDGVTGWWFYLNFVAEEVDYIGM